MSNELTPWFPAKVRPVRVGYYERDYGISVDEVPDYWDGRRWWVVPVSNLNERMAGVPNLPWRGLAKKP